MRKIVSSSRARARLARRYVLLASVCLGGPTVAVAATSPVKTSVVNVATYGAKGDMQVVGYAHYTIAAGSTTLLCDAGVFSQAMVGQLIVVPGAGVNGAGLMANITGYTNQGQVTLSVAASTSLAGVNELPEAGTDNTAFFDQAWADAQKEAIDQGGSAYIVASIDVPDGMYMVRTLNFTGSGSYSIKISGNATIWGVNAGAPIVDAIGSRYIKWDGVSLLGDQYSMPSVGLLLGRSGDTGHNSADESVFRDMLISGFFTEAAMQNEQSETTLFSKDFFYNNNSNAGTYAVVMDGVKYFPVNTMVAGGDQEPANQGESFDENVFVNCTFGAYTPLWIGVTNRMTVIGGYAVAAGPYGAVLYTVPGGDNLQLHLDLHQEDVNNAMQYSFLLTGTDPYPYLEGFHDNENGSTATIAEFKVDPQSAIQAVSMPAADIDITSFPLGAKTLFADPGKWGFVSGRVHVPDASFMDISTFHGTLSTSTGETNYAALAPGSIQQALANQGIIANTQPSGVRISDGGHYYVTGTPYQPPVTFTAAPAGGVTTTGHVNAYLLSGWGGIGAQGTGYQVANDVPVVDQNGNTVFYGNILAVNGAGAITNFQFFAPGPVYAHPSVPSSLTVQQQGAQGAVTSGTNFAVYQVAIDTPGAGYTALPGVTIDSTNSAPGAVGVAVPTAMAIAAPLQAQGGLQVPLATPSSSSAPCTPGTQEEDANYSYLCTAPNTWKRSASTWSTF